MFSQIRYFQHFRGKYHAYFRLSKISPDPVLKNTKLLVTKGFTSAIKVDGGKIKSCSSANKQIATVTNSGKVTGKKRVIQKLRLNLQMERNLFVMYLLNQINTVGKSLPSVIPHIINIV